MNLGRLCQIILLKIGQGNQWFRAVSATCDFRISHGTANSAHCTSPAVLPRLQRRPHNLVFNVQYRIL